jgi:hypothetical protein
MDGPPPGNGDGPRGSGPTPEELTRRGEDKSGFCVAQPCTHPVTRTERFPGGLPHYSHEVCVACGRHLRRHPKPRNDERRKLLAAYVARLATCERLTSWEKGFVASVSKQRNLSPKQEAIIGRLYRQRWGSAP